MIANQIVLNLILALGWKRLTLMAGNSNDTTKLWKELGSHGIAVKVVTSFSPETCSVNDEDPLIILSGNTSETLSTYSCALQRRAYLTLVVDGSSFKR